MSGNGSLPEVIPDENGDGFYAVGHVDPTAFVLSMVLHLAEHGDDEEALNLFGFKSSRTGRREDDLRRAAEDLISGVCHVYAKPSSGADEDAVLEWCDANDEDAELWTSVTL